MTDTIENTEIDKTQDAEAAADDQITLDDLILVFDRRAQTYGLLARLYRKELTADLVQELHDQHYRVSTGNANLDEGNRLIATYLSGLWENSVTELAADYMRTFFGHGYSGHAAAYPFESVYSSEKRLLMQGARDEVLALYRAAGLDKTASWKEGEDHIALELEYMQVLIERAAQALRDGDEPRAVTLTKSQYNFMEDHLGAWAPLLTEQMKHFSKTKFYTGLAFMTDGFLETDTMLMEDLLSIDEEAA